MSNLLNTVNGRNALIVAQKWLLERRMSRFFKRTIAIDIEQFRTGGAFDLETMLGVLNPAHDAEILMIYQLLGALGGLQTTYSDLTYYVNAATGSDVTGDGTLANPYASTWFLDNLPRRIAHKVRIGIVGNLVESTKDVVLDFDFVTREASLSIFGIGAPTIAVDNILVGAGGVTSLRAEGGDSIDIVTLGPANRNQFIKAKTGADAGKAVPIYSAIAGTAVLTRYNVIAGTVAGNTCAAIEPSVTWKVNTLRSMCRGDVHYSNLDGRGAPLAVVNLNIDFTVWAGPILNTENFSWKNECPSVISFVKFLSTIQAGAIIEGGQINTLNAVDPDIDALSLVGITNLNNSTAGLSPTICGFILAEDSGTNIRLTIRRAIVRGLHTRWTVLMDGGKETVEFGWAGIFRARETIFKVTDAIATGETGGLNNSGGGFDVKDSGGYAQRITVIDSDCVVVLRGGSRVFTNTVGSDATFSVIGYAGAWMYGHNDLEVETFASSGDPALDGFAGAVAELAAYQTGIGLTTYAWPAIGVDAGVSKVYMLA